MKWIVFALGSVFGLGGLVAIWEGLDVLQPERGFTLVISGATALSAGVVTIALGFVVACIEALIAVSANKHAMAPIDVDPAAASVEAPLAEAASVTDAALNPAAPFDAGEQPAAADVGVPQLEYEPDFSLEDLGFRLPQPRVADKTAVDAEAPRVPSPATRRSTSFVAPPRVPKKSVSGLGHWPSKPASVAAEPDAPAQAERAPSADEQDWLERALAGVETEQSTAPKPEEDEAQRKAKANLSPAQEPATPAVVGRYESNGASYALFADGSIEAEMDGGTYHFKSLAELKTFIEGRASS